VVSAVLGILDGRWQAVVGGLVAVVFLVVLAVRGRRTPTPASVKARIPFISGAVFLLLSAVALAPLYLVPVFSLPDPGGEYPVGVRDFALTDTSRHGVLNAPADQPRRLVVRNCGPPSPGWPATSWGCRRSSTLTSGTSGRTPTPAHRCCTATDRCPSSSSAMDWTPTWRRTPP
jgi:hypothetical protein